MSTLCMAAAIVLLMTKYDLQPERDYQWRFTYDPEDSIREIADGRAAIAPVASDVLDRMVASGEVAEDSYRVIYESERFPPATLGYAHNLPEGMRNAIRETLLGFEFEESSVAEKYSDAGATQFVAVDYKDDWANIRRIDETVERVREEAQVKK